MTLAHILLVLAVLALAAVFGGMLFFAAVYAPLVFARLPEDQAGRFIRAVFPVYYLVMGLTTLLAAVLLFAATRLAVESGALALVAAGFAFARQVLIPRINRYRDQGAPAEESFNRLHRFSVILNFVQFLLVTAVLVRLVAMGLHWGGA